MAANKHIIYSMYVCYDQTMWISRFPKENRKASMDCLEKHDAKWQEKASKIVCTQWRSQPDNLVPLCKFQIISLFISLEIDCFYSQWTVNICMAGLNRQAGYATVCTIHVSWLVISIALSL